MRTNRTLPGRSWALALVLAAGVATLTASRPAPACPESQSMGSAHKATTRVAVRQGEDLWEPMRPAATVVARTPKADAPKAAAPTAAAPKAATCTKECATPGCACGGEASKACGCKAGEGQNDCAQGFVPGEQVCECER